MTISSFSAAKIVCELAFTAAVGTVIAVSTAQLVLGLDTGISDDPPNSSNLPHQFTSIYANHSVSGGTGTLVLFMVDSDIPSGLGKFCVLDTLTIVGSTTLRQSYDNLSGNYVASVVAALSLRNTVDIHPSIGQNTTPPKIYAACTVLSGGTLNVQFSPGRSI